MPSRDEAASYRRLKARSVVLSRTVSMLTASFLRCSKVESKAALIPVVGGKLKQRTIRMKKLI